MKYVKISKCRICGNSNLTDIFSLGVQALTGVFPHSKNEKITEGPVDLVKCTGFNVCGLVQLRQSYDVDEMYGGNYGYRSGLNQSMVSHLHAKVSFIQNFINIEDRDLIIDIGSNDATTLLAYPRNKYSLMGVDPTAKKFKDYYPSSISLIDDFFSYEKINKIIKKKAKVITSFSMFYDLENPVEFAEEIFKTLEDNGIWVFEQSYLPSMITTNSFDTICHEHLEFYALKQIKWICDLARLKIIHIEFNEINGGSISIVASKVNSNFQECKQIISDILEKEILTGLDSIEYYNNFINNINITKLKLMNFLENVKKDNKLIVGIGASTKGNVLLQYFNITEKLLPCIGEVNPDKIGRYTPSTNIPLLSEDEAIAMNPDYFLVLPWHFKNYFINSDKFKNKNLVFPLPHLEIIEN